MPIGDLLASITGASDPPAPKRKATDDLRSSVTAKTQRTTVGASNGTPRPATANAVQRPDRPATTTATPTSRPTPISRLSTDKPSAFPVKQLSSSLSRSLSAPSNGIRSPAIPTKRPAPPPPAKVVSSPTNTAPKAPPKKGSYKALMERAKRVQEQREANAGPGIRHQAVAVGKAPLKSQLKADAAIAQIRMAKSGPVDKLGYAGTARPGVGDRNGGDRKGGRLPVRNGQTTGGAVRGGKVARPLNGKATKPAPIEEKKVKKAAIATTGYQGTARGPAKTDKPSASSARSSASAQARMPFQRPRRRDDEYDEDMDDFIEDEEEEDDGGRYGGQYRYAGDDDEDESDMEAGLSDIAVEEQRADFFARREDAEEAAREANRVADKERKKQLWAARRGA